MKDVPRDDLILHMQNEIISTVKLINTPIPHAVTSFLLSFFVILEV